MTEEKYSSLILKTAAKTLLFVVGFISLVISYIFMISPGTLGNAYSKLGMGNAEIATYEKAYAQSNKNADLYNLIQKCLEKENYKKSSGYIEELLAKPDFEAFAASVNKASVDKAVISDVAFVVDLESYLNGQLLVCKYRLGEKEKAKAMALSDLESEGNKYSFLLGVYYDEVLTDLSLTVAEAKNQLMQIYNNDQVKIYIDAKVNALDYTQETSEKLQAATLYNKIKVMNYKRNLMKFVGLELTDINNEINNLQEIYNDLID